MAAFLDDNRLSYEDIQTFSTPRRLAVRVIGLADQQSDLTEDFKGPSKENRLGCRWKLLKSGSRIRPWKRLDRWWYRIPWSQRGRVRLCHEHEAGKPAKEVLAGLQKCLLHWPSLLACTGLTIHLNTSAQFTPWSFFWATKRSTLISWISSQVVWAVDTVSLDMKWKSPMRIRYEEDLRTVYVIAEQQRAWKHDSWANQGYRSRTRCSVQIEEGLLNEVLNLVEYPHSLYGKLGH